MPDFPREPAKFKQWADAACVDWPGELTIKATAAWYAMAKHSAYSEADTTEFSNAYANYLAQNR